MIIQKLIEKVKWWGVAILFALATAFIAAFVFMVLSGSVAAQILSIFAAWLSLIFVFLAIVLMAYLKHYVDDDREDKYEL